MGKLDEILAKAKDLARVAGSKTEEVVEITKLKMQASQMRSEIDANYLKLGEVIYELKKAGAENEELISMCIAEIESQLSDLDALENKINEMKNMVKCNTCMSANPVGALYCSRCGNPLKEDLKPVHVQEQTPVLLETSRQSVEEEEIER